MADDERGWLLRYHPFSYGFLSLVFAVPAVYGLLMTWPHVAGLPGVFPGHWRTVALFATLLSVGMGLRSMTPISRLVDSPGEETR